MNPIIAVFTYQPCHNVAPFAPLKVPREVGFYDGPDICPGNFLGFLQCRKDEWNFVQQAVGREARLTASNLRTIADKIQLLNEQEKRRQKASQKARQKTSKTP